jgi:AMP-polyphosphate phosphotransferase
MFESAKLEHRLDKAAFREIEPTLRTDLLDAEFDLVEAKRHAVMVLLNGPDGAGKGEVLNRLYEWLDARHLDTIAYDGWTDEEKQRPPIWRYWRDMPAKGEIGIVIGSWYHQLLVQRAHDRIDKDGFTAALHAVNEFEAMLHAEGVRLLKIWLHVDPDESWRRHRKQRGDADVRHPIVEEWGSIKGRKQRTRIVAGALEAVRVTSTGLNPWEVVPAGDPEYRDLAVGRLLLDALRRANAEASPPAEAGVSAASPRAKSAAARGRAKVRLDLPRVAVTAALDMEKSVTRQEYEKEFPALQERLRAVVKRDSFAQRGLVCVFEGNDAAGKGGAIRRARACFDPRQFRVHPVAAPTETEKLYPYLWRFWRHVPRQGHIAIFDRSWYGRVLVERVEGFCRREDWLRAYDEINDFELAMSRAGLVVVKLWLSITQDEQMRRFKAREETSFKRFKITPEDWRNREKWPLYEEALTDMVDRTSTEYAPWTLVEANDKLYARLKVLRTIVDAVEAALD